MAEISEIWEFVEKYYPNYSSCDKIAENDDLSKISNNEIDPDSGAEELYFEIRSEVKTHWNGADKATINAEVQKEVEKRLIESNAYIYEKAIEGYIESLKTQE